MVSEEGGRNGVSTAPMPDLVVVQAPESDAAQAYRSVRETLRHARRDDPVRSILLADVGSSDRTGEAAANIAASFALNGDPTVLIDADAEQPIIHERVNAAPGPGLLDWLVAGSADNGLTPLPTAVRNFDIVPVGASQPGFGSLADLLTSQACERLIVDLGRTAHYVVFHASVVSVSSQALTIAANVDAVLLVVQSGTTKRTDAQRARESLERVGANLLGAVLVE